MPPIWRDGTLTIQLRCSKWADWRSAALGQRNQPVTAVGKAVGVDMTFIVKSVEISDRCETQNLTSLTLSREVNTSFLYS
jgi:hypothetical protein